MPRLSDLLYGLSAGAGGEIQAQRQRKQEMADKIAMMEAEARAKQKYPSASDLIMLQYLRQMGFPISGEDGTPQSSPAPQPILPPDIEKRMAEPNAIAVPAITESGKGVAIGEGEAEPGTSLDRAELLRRVGISPQVFPSTSQLASSGFQPSSATFRGIRFTNPTAIESETAARSRGIAKGRPIRLRAGQQDTALGYQQSLQSLNKLSRLIEENPVIKTGLTGIGTSRWEFIRGSKMGNYLRQNQPPEVSEFFTAYNRLQDSYRRFITGAQAGFPEIALFLPTALPNPSVDRPEQFRRNLQSFQSELQQGVERMKNVLSSEGLTDEQIEKVFAGLPQESFSQDHAGGKRMRDANGNEAIVYPDGTIEEMP